MTQETIMKEDGYVLVSKAADAAGVHATTLYRLIDDGKVTGQKAGGTRYVNQRELIAYYSAAPSIARRIQAL